MLITALCMITAGGGNLIGRLVCGAMQDKTPKKHFPYYVMTIASLAVCLVATALIFGAPHWVVAFIAIFFVQFFFGFGFAGLPGILHKSYGMKQLASIQGYMLTAWAIAAIVGPLIATGILNLGTPSIPYPDYANYPYYYPGTPGVIGTLGILLIVLAGMFAVQLVFLFLFAKLVKNEKPPQDDASEVVATEVDVATDEIAVTGEESIADEAIATSETVVTAQQTN